MSDQVKYMTTKTIITTDTAMPVQKIHLSCTRKIKGGGEWEKERRKTKSGKITRGWDISVSTMQANYVVCRWHHSAIIIHFRYTNYLRFGIAPEVTTDCRLSILILQQIKNNDTVITLVHYSTEIIKCIPYENNSTSDTHIHNCTIGLLSQSLSKNVK